MYRIETIYGDSFHQEHDVSHLITEVSWKSLSQAKKALNDIKNHYHYYVILNKEWNADNDDKEKAKKSAKMSKWYDNKYPDFTIHLENDDGKRVPVQCCWTGYFESLVGAYIVPEKDEGMSFRYRD